MTAIYGDEDGGDEFVDDDDDAEAVDDDDDDDEDDGDVPRHTGGACAGSRVPCLGPKFKNLTAIQATIAMVL